MIFEPQRQAYHAAPARPDRTKKQPINSDNEPHWCPKCRLWFLWAGRDTHQNIKDLKFVRPLDDYRQGILKNYIQRREERNVFINANNESFILVRKPLVNLAKGAGFGELALMGFSKRMASVMTITESCIATLDRGSFTHVMRRAQKKKIAEQVSFLKKFPFYHDFSQIKL